MSLDGFRLFETGLSLNGFRLFGLMLSKIDASYLMGLAAGLGKS